MPTFSPTVAPSYGSPKDKDFRISRADFGDGYSQRVGDGINVEREIWQLSWNMLTSLQASNISDFFDAREGTEAFAWLTPNAETKNFTVQTYTKTPIANGLFSMAATLEQDLNN